MPAPSSVTPQEWDRIVNVFARHDGRARAAARELGWPVARAQRILDKGYPSAGYPPVRTLLSRDAGAEESIRAGRAEREEEERERVENEKELARAGMKLQRTGAREDEARVKELVNREAQRERARQDALASRTEEATLVSSARRNAIALNGVTAQVLRGAIQLSDRIRQRLEEEARTSKLTLSEQLQLVRQAAQIARFNAEAGLQAVKSERMVMGAGEEPGEGEVQQANSLEDSARWIEKSVTALQRAKERGLIAEKLLADIHQASETPKPEVITAQSELVAPGIQNEPDDPDQRAELPTADQERALRKQRVRTRGRMTIVPSSNT